jgi:hypothetical protein
MYAMTDHQNSGKFNSALRQMQAKRLLEWVDRNPAITAPIEREATLTPRIAIHCGICEINRSRIDRIYYADCLLIIA